MNFDSLIIDTDEWKGSGTISGVHTHTAPIVLTTNAKLASAADETSTLEVLSDKVVIEKDLLVKGNLHAPGFTPGNDGVYPPNPTFSDVTATHSINNMGMTTTAFLHSTGPATVDGVLQAVKVKTIDLETDTLASKTTGLISVTDETEFTDLVTFKQNTTFQNHIEGSTAGFQEINTYTGGATFWEANVLKSRTEGSKIQVADELNFQQDVTSDKKITAQDIVGTNMVGGATITADQELSAPQITGGTVSGTTFTADTLNVNGTATVHGELLPQSLKVTEDIEGQNMHVKGDLTVDGTTNISATIPSHLYPNKITMNHDYTTGHQKTELTYNKITLEDTTVTGFADITLDGAEGTIKCNGGITCHNQYASTANPAGVTCDYVNTLNVAIDTITGHRSDFGRNVAGESIYCNGQIESHSLKTTSIFGGITCLGNWNFNGATVSGLPGGGGTTYPSITEHTDYVQISKELKVSDIKTNEITNEHDNSAVHFIGAMDFTIRKHQS